MNSNTTRRINLDIKHARWKRRIPLSIPYKKGIIPIDFGENIVVPLPSPSPSAERCGAIPLANFPIESSIISH